MNANGLHCSVPWPPRVLVRDNICSYSYTRLIELWQYPHQSSPVNAGANICWAYGNALRCIGADMDPEELFPPEEVLAVTTAGAAMQGRRPCSKGLLMALEHGPWAAAGKSVEAIIPSSYVEGPLWGLADGFGIPAAVFGGWGFSSGRDSERKRKKAAKAKRKAQRKSQRTWRMAQKARELLKEGSGASRGGVAGREILEALADMDEPAAVEMSGDCGDGEEDGAIKRVDDLADGGEGLPLLNGDDAEAPADGGISCSDAPVGTVILGASGEPLLQKITSGDETEDGFSIWRNIPLHAAMHDRKLTMVERSAEAEGGRAADDIAILRRAAETAGTIVSNDLFRDHRGALKRLQRSSTSSAADNKARARRRVGYDFVKDSLASSGSVDEGGSEALAAGGSNGSSLQLLVFIPHDGSTQQHQADSDA